MDVAVVTVGDELLAGDTTNTNMAWLGQRLTDRGASVERGLVVPDEEDVIASEVERYAATFDAVVVTGGLGPTHDDVTMEGVARAFDRPVEEHPDAVAYFQDHADYEYADLTTETAHLPRGSRVLPNDVGVAPGAVVENVYVLPGVPDEMKAMFEDVADEFTGTPMHVEFVETDEPESALLDVLEAVQERFDVTVGSYPGDGVRIKIQSADPEAVEEATDWLAHRV